MQWDSLHQSRPEPATAAGTADAAASDANRTAERRIYFLDKLGPEQAHTSDGHT